MKNGIDRDMAIGAFVVDLSLDKLKNELILFMVIPKKLVLIKVHY